MAKQRKRKSKSFGTKGLNRVRLFADHGVVGALRVEYTDEGGKRKSVKLATSDWSEAEAKAAQIAAELAKGTTPKQNDVTLGRLIDNWLTEVTPRKSATMQHAERASLALLLESWGASTTVTDLDEGDWSTFIEQRRNGTLKSEKSHYKTGVSNRTIAMDLKTARAVIKRAMRTRVNGKRLVEYDPFDGLKTPVEANPKRPIVSSEEYAKLERAAIADSHCLVSLFLTVTRYTGHRVGSIRHLRWSDIDIEKGFVTFRAEHDKKRRGHVVPLHKTASNAILQRLRESVGLAGSDHWMFPSPEDHTQPLSKALVSDWWRRLERRAELPRIKGRGWHSLRRKFATDLKHLPLSDLMALGNWRDGGTVVRSYMKADEATMRDGLTKLA